MAIETGPDGEIAVATVAGAASAVAGEWTVVRMACNTAVSTKRESVTERSGSRSSKGAGPDVAPVRMENGAAGPGTVAGVPARSWEPGVVAGRAFVAAACEPAAVASGKTSVEVTEGACAAAATADRAIGWPIIRPPCLPRHLMNPRSDAHGFLYLPVRVVDFFIICNADSSCLLVNFVKKIIWTAAIV